MAVIRKNCRKRVFWQITFNEFYNKAPGPIKTGETDRFTDNKYWIKW